MLSLWRSCRGVQHQVQILNLNYARNHVICPELFAMESTLSTRGRGRGENVLQQRTSPSETETMFFPLGGLGMHSNGIFPSNHFGCDSHIRCITTVGISKDTSGQENDTVSSNTLIPPRIKVKRLDKTAKHIMNILDKEAVDQIRSEREIPDVQPGYIVEIKVEAPENKGRISTVKGLVIARRNSGISTAIRVRRLESSVGTESLFPLYSPNIKGIKVIEKRSVRRAKLYYVRDRPFNVALRELAQRTAKKKDMVLRGKRMEQSKQGKRTEQSKEN